MTSRAIRTDVEQTRFDAADAEIAWIARGLGARGMHYPALIGRASLERAGYTESFPHLLLCAAHYDLPPEGGSHERESEGGSHERESGGGSHEKEQAAPWCLSPAVCYHVYEQFAGATVAEPLTLTARGVCFRGERETAPGIRQIEFEMREIVFLGPPEWVKTHSGVAVKRVTALAERLGLHGEWHPAEDPFFLPAAAGKALMQRLLGVKEEYRSGGTNGLALASVNRHGAFFGERFDIDGPDGAPIHTACVAIGLDRWYATLASVTGQVSAGGERRPQRAEGERFENAPPRTRSEVGSGPHRAK